MKYKIFFFIILAAFLLWLACEPPVVFKEAQPKGIKTQNTFNEKYQGTYFCDSDSSWVKVEPTLIYKEKTFLYVSTRSEIELNEYIDLNGNTAYIEHFDAYVNLTEMGDDLLGAEVILRDTFFQIGKKGLLKGVLKSYKGNEIMNTQFDNGHWQVEILTLDKNRNLSYARTKVPEDLKALEDITDVNTLILPEGENQYELAPTRAEFKKILKTNLVFEECDYFVRVRQPAIAI